MYNLLLKIKLMKQFIFSHILFATCLAICLSLTTPVSAQGCSTPDVQQSAVIFTASGATSIGEAEFTLGEDAEGNPKKVKFALGNLQYKPSTGEWRIAQHQYDYVGGGFNGQKCYPGSDLWDGEYGTVYENGVKCWNIRIGTATDAGHAGWIDALTFEEVPNTITINGETFRKPTADEYEYLCGINKNTNHRDNAEQLRARARIILDEETPHGNTFVNGMLLLPDDWDPKVLLAGKTIIPDLNGKDGCWFFYDNIITEGEWRLLEAQGAIFLPAAGNPNGKDGSKYNRSGFYWTSTPAAKADHCITLEFGGYPYQNQNCTPVFEVRPKNYRRTFRLCQDVEVEVEEEEE